MLKSLATSIDWLAGSYDPLRPRSEYQTVAVVSRSLIEPDLASMKPGKIGAF